MSHRIVIFCIHSSWCLGYGVQFHRLHRIVGAGWRWVVSFTHWLLYPWGRGPCYPVVSEAVWMLWRREKTLAPTRDKTLCCTDWAILAPIYLTVQTLLCCCFFGRGQQWGAELIWQQYCRNSGQKRWSVSYFASCILNRSTSSIATATLWCYQHWISHTAWEWKHQFCSRESGFSLSSI
jgi:hypothetical protein